ncbi:MAG: hypothetical protein JNK72_00190 [Myxococcales bacterium]|nr:hypothetical protein [Myxococcales bacterium]
MSFAKASPKPPKEHPDAKHLGARRGDTLDDLYPGTGVVGRVWAEVFATGGMSLGDEDDGGSQCPS